MRFLSILGVLVLVGVSGCGKPTSNSEAVASARVVRQAPGPPIATPPPADRGPPLAGPPGFDADGSPTQYVDYRVVRAMLARKEYGELTKFFEKLQSDFESNPAYETWVFDAADAFHSAEPTLLADLNEWVAASPDSFAPYLARGNYWESVGFARRGTAWGQKTSEQDFNAMHEAFGHARADLDKTLSLRPKVIATQRNLIQIGHASGDAALANRAISSALAACPACFRIRITQMAYSTPQWGGSYAQMQDFAKASAKAGPKMKLLVGYIDLDKADHFAGEKRLKEARDALDHACSLGEHWEFVYRRGKFELNYGDKSKALVDLDRAAALRPGEPAVLADRARALAFARRYEDAGRDLRSVFLVQPTNRGAKELVPNVVDGLLYEADQHRIAGRRDDAIRMLDVAIELTPDDARVKRSRAWTILGDAGGPNAIDELEAAVKATPNSFALRQQLDYALAKQRSFDRVVELWTEYLALHPDDGRAYLERGGAHFNLRHLAEAKADATKACELGVSEGCVRTKQLP